MFIRLLPFILLVSIACQSGKIDCPKVRDDEIKRSKFKRFQTSSAALWAHHAPRHTTHPNAKDYGRYRYGKKNNSLGNKEINTVSAEEWDCPRPWLGKYMPKAVKKNIRSNLAKINSELDLKNDSLRTISRGILFQNRLAAGAKSRFYNR